MSDLVARLSTARPNSYPQIRSTPLTVVALFCLLGLALTAAILPLFDQEQVSWVLSHLE